MSTFISEPGTRIGGRYRLEDRLGASGGWSAWKAIDETLARPVTVLTFAPGFTRIREVITAARAASRLSDARLAQVFDVEENGDGAYVVLEWVAGDSLHDLLADGPLEPMQSAELIAESAAALANAHSAGLAHLCLTPGSLRWTPGGGVKLIGLGIDAALSGTTASDPALADTWGLGRLLYAALTAHWPGNDWPALPPPPLTPDGLPCTPRQVRAGVPAAVDEITCQALFAGANGVPALTTPAMLASALSAVIPAPAAPPPAALTDPISGTGWHPPSARDTDPRYWHADADPGWGSPNRGGRRRGPLVIAAVVVVAALGIGFWAIGNNGGTPHSGATPTQSTSHPATTATVLVPVSAGGFDALSSQADDPGNENTDQAKFTIDHNPGSHWSSQFYEGNPVFGRLKTGTGLILDMGKPVRLASVTVSFGATPGADVSIKLGNSNVRDPATLSSFTTVASATDIGGTHTFTVTSKATGRYVLIWFTKLPPLAGSSNKYEAQIYNIAVRGFS